jgi:HPt (histidine-containing phosphotransfer) domain-containing protein
MKKYIAHVDPELCDLIPTFLTNKRTDARTILSGVFGCHIDFEAVARIGHKLKGEGGSYGLDDISVFGAKIELAARNHDADKIRHYASELADYLDSLQIEYE